MKRMLPILISLFVSTFAMGHVMIFNIDNDPAARKILEKLKQKYDAYASMEIKFELELDLPDQDKQIQKGKIIQSGDKFSLDTEDYDMYCDGSSVWLYSELNQEVQINDADFEDSDEIMSPKDFMKIYESGDYEYTIVGEGKENGKSATFIEFKPLNEYSEYAKIRLAVKKSTPEVLSLKVFSKDGSRYKFSILSLMADKKYDHSVFVFDTKAHPDVFVEDLRIE